MESLWPAMAARVQIPPPALPDPDEDKLYDLTSLLALKHGTESKIAWSYVRINDATFNFLSLSLVQSMQKHYHKIGFKASVAVYLAILSGLLALLFVLS